MLSMILASMFTLVHSSDAGVDDFVTSALIAAAQEKNKQEDNEFFDFASIIITNADCEPISALSGYQKTVSFLNMSTTVALSSSRVWTQFPWIWRMDSEAVNQLGCLKNEVINQVFSVEGNNVLANILKEAVEVKIIATGPLTTIADVLKIHPELMDKISEIHWMGGAIDTAGNLIESPEIPNSLLNEDAEWNVFSDPHAVDWIFKNTSFAIYLYPLDISDATVPNFFIDILRENPETKYSKYVKECYEITEKIDTYRMWDVVAASGILFPEILNPPVKERLRVGLTGREEGVLIKDPIGREVFVYKQFRNNDVNMFYAKVANILTSPIDSTSQ